MDDISVVSPAPPGGENLVMATLGGAVVGKKRCNIRPSGGSEPYNLREGIFPAIRIAFELFGRN